MLRSHRCYCVLCLALALTLALAFFLLDPPRASAQPPKKGPLSFINDVAPILKENCFACHDAKKRKGKLDLTTYEGLRKGGARELDLVAPGKPDESLILDMLTATDKSRMPPPETGDALPKAKIALIEQWIKEGAKLDDGLTPKSDLLRELRVRWVPPAPESVYPHAVPITALAFTPDGQKIIAGGNHELTIWNIANGKLEKRIRTRAERAYAMAFLPDGKLAVAGGRPGQEGDVRIYNITAAPAKMDGGVAVLDGVNDKNVLVKHLLESDDSVLCLDVSADGKRLVCGGCDRLVNVFDLSGGYANAKAEQPPIENHADWVFGVSLAADGQHLLTCSRDKTAKVWDLKTKESVLTFPAHQNTVYAVAVAKDGKSGFSVGEDNQVRQWVTSGDGRQLRAMAHNKPVLKLVHNPKQPLLASCSADQTVRIWNEQSGAAVRTLSGHTDWVYSVAFSADGGSVAAGAHNGEVRVWKVADGVLVKAFNATPGAAATAEAPKK
jgi:mono/diheme cytochrome c family protein